MVRRQMRGMLERRSCNCSFANHSAGLETGLLASLNAGESTQVMCVSHGVAMGVAGTDS